MTDATEPPSAQIRITGGNASADEIAAVTAVLTAALEQLAGEARRRVDHRPDAWARSQRTVREALPADWRAFGR